MLHGYRLDISTLEELNFYFDPPAPLPAFKQIENLSVHLAKERKGWVLMPKSVYEDSQEQGLRSLALVKEIPYKKEILVLTQMH